MGFRRRVRRRALVVGVAGGAAMAHHALPRSPGALDAVTLTPAGRDAASAFHRDLSASLSRLTEVLPPGERAGFCRSLARVAADAPWPAPGSAGVTA